MLAPRIFKFQVTGLWRKRADKAPRIGKLFDAQFDFDETIASPFEEERWKGMRQKIIKHRGKILRIIHKCVVQGNIYFFFSLFSENKRGFYFVS